MSRACEAAILALLIRWVLLGPWPGPGPSWPILWGGLPMRNLRGGLPMRNLRGGLPMRNLQGGQK
jgi:hypothetical protein